MRTRNQAFARIANEPAPGQSRRPTPNASDLTVSAANYFETRTTFTLMPDAINQLLAPETQATILQALTALTICMPAFEWLASKTKNTFDDHVVAFVLKALSLVPRVRLGNAAAPKAGQK